MTIPGIIQRWRRWKLARCGLRLDRSCYVGPHVSLGQDKVSRGGRVSMGEDCQLGQGAELAPFGGSIRVANHVWLGPYVVIYGHGSVEIGEWSMVAMHATILSSNHSVPGMDRCMRWEKDVLLPTKIGRDVWIGANAVVLGGVTIGDGAVIAAGSVVARDVAPGFVVAGNPAVVVKKRKQV